MFVGHSHPQPVGGLAWQAVPLMLNAMALLPSPGLWKDPCILLSGGGISAPCRKGPGTCAQSCWTSGPPLAVSHDPQPGAPQEWRCQLSIAVSFSAGLVREGSTSPSPWLPPTPPHPTPEPGPCQGVPGGAWSRTYPFWCWAGLLPQFPFFPQSISPYPAGILSLTFPFLGVCCIGTAHIFSQPS